MELFWFGDSEGGTEGPKNPIVPSKVVKTDSIIEITMKFPQLISLNPGINNKCIIKERGLAYLSFQVGRQNEPPPRLLSASTNGGGGGSVLDRD